MPISPLPRVNIENNKYQGRRPVPTRISFDIESVLRAETPKRGLVIMMITMTYHYKNDFSSTLMPWKAFVPLQKAKTPETPTRRCLTIKQKQELIKAFDNLRKRVRLRLPFTNNFTYQMFKSIFQILLNATFPHQLELRELPGSRAVASNASGTQVKIHIDVWLPLFCSSSCKAHRVVP